MKLVNFTSHWHTNKLFVEPWNEKFRTTVSEKENKEASERPLTVTQTAAGTSSFVNDKIYRNKLNPSDSIFSGMFDGATLSSGQTCLIAEHNHCM